MSRPVLEDNLMGTFYDTDSARGAARGLKSSVWDFSYCVRISTVTARFPDVSASLVSSLHQPTYSKTNYKTCLCFPRLPRFPMSLSLQCEGTQGFHFLLFFTFPNLIFQEPSLGMTFLLSTVLSRQFLGTTIQIPMMLWVVF